MITFDLTTLVLLAGMVVSLIAAETALYGDTLTLHINVSPKIGQAGFDSPTPEQIFIAETAPIAPRMRRSSRSPTR
jgi:hypothetical protein